MTQKLLFHYRADGNKIYYSSVEGNDIKFMKTTLFQNGSRDDYYLLWGEFLAELHSAYTRKKSVTWDKSMLEISNIVYKKQKTEKFWHYCSGCFRPFERVARNILEDDRGEYVWGRFKGLSTSSRIYVSELNGLYKCKECLGSKTY
jgi:hypothetical protein